MQRWCTHWETNTVYKLYIRSLLRKRASSFQLKSEVSRDISYSIWTHAPPPVRDWENGASKYWKRNGIKIAQVNRRPEIKWTIKWAKDKWMDNPSKEAIERDHKTCTRTRSIALYISICRIHIETKHNNNIETSQSLLILPTVTW